MNDYMLLRKRLYFNLHALKLGASSFRYNDLVLYSLSSAAHCYVHAVIHNMTDIQALRSVEAPPHFRTNIKRSYTEPRNDLIALALSVFPRTRVVFLLLLLRYTPFNIQYPTCLTSIS